MSLKEPRTASADDSIWFDLSEATFRQHLVALEERTNTVPMSPRVFKAEMWTSNFASDTEYTLPHELEQQVADDFACLVAVAEGAQSVAAVCIEELRDGKGLTLRFAAMDVSLNEKVKMALQAAVHILTEAASSPEPIGSASDHHVEQLFDIVLRLHELRLLARLRSQKWEKPKYLSKSHKKPLWQDFANLSHRAQFAYKKQEIYIKQSIESQLKELSQIYETFESCEDNLASLKHLVDASFTFCSRNEVRNYLQRLQNQTKQTAQIAAAIKSLRQIQKIANYRRMAINLIRAAQNYPSLFHSISIAYLIPYKSVSTSVGHHEWANTCHVHAEVQLAVHYDLHPEHRPRIIGTSKWLCYLCYHFLCAHQRFFPSKTHGQLFDQWTIPDLSEYDSSIVERYRGIVRDMDEAVIKQFNEEPDLLRLQPMTSCTVE